MIMGKPSFRGWRGGVSLMSLSPNALFSFVILNRVKNPLHFEGRGPSLALRMTFGDGLLIVICQRQTPQQAFLTFNHGNETLKDISGRPDVPP